MAANNMKFLSFIASIVLFITIVQVDTTSEANYTLTRIPEAYSNKYAVKRGPQPKALLEKSIVTTFDATKTTKSPEQYSTTMPKVKASKPSKKLKKFDSHKKLIDFGRNDSDLPTLTRAKNNGSMKSPKVEKDHITSSSILKASEPKTKYVHKIDKLPDLKDSKVLRSGKLLKHVHKKIKASEYIKKGRAKREVDDNLDVDTFDSYSDVSQDVNPSFWNAAGDFVSKFFKAMDDLNKKYNDAINQFVKEIGPNFNKEMYDVMLFNRSVSERALFNAKGVASAVPAGLHLGGYGVLKDSNSLVCFHRTKLRNKTSFILSLIENDIRNMEVRSRIRLGDLHLQGDYERLMIDVGSPQNLYYAPTYGSLSLLLRDVSFLMKGRYRVANGRLLVEEIISNIIGKDALLIYLNELPKSSERAPNPVIKFEDLEDFVDKIKIDLNHWVKDYFNDYLTYFGLASKEANKEFQIYDKKKTLMHNDFTEHVVRLIRWKLSSMSHNFEVEGDNTDSGNLTTSLPDFTINVVTGMKLKCTHGKVQGLASVYRRSTANGPSFSLSDRFRAIDSIVGFSDLKVVYKYEATTAEGPPMQGQLILTANDLTAHMRITITLNSKSVVPKFDEIHPMKVQSLTIEGPVSRMIGSYKHILENHIVALLVNSLVNKIKELKNVFKSHGYENTDLDPPPQMKEFDQVEPNVDDNDNHLDPPVDPDAPIGNSNQEQHPVQGGHDESIIEDNHSQRVDDNVDTSGQGENPNEEAPPPDVNNEYHVAPDTDPNEDTARPVGHQNEYVEPDEGGNENFNEENNSPAVEHVDKDENRADLAVEKSDSIDLEIPADSQHTEARQVHVDMKEQYKVYERKPQQLERRFAGRQELAKKGGKHSRSELIING